MYVWLLEPACAGRRKRYAGPQLGQFGLMNVESVAFTFACPSGPGAGAEGLGPRALWLSARKPLGRAHSGKPVLIYWQAGRCSLGSQNARTQSDGLGLGFIILNQILGSLGPRTQIHHSKPLLQLKAFTFLGHPTCLQCREAIPP